MALVAKAIKQKIKAVKNIGKITKTMEMVSVSKMRRAVARVIASRPYAEHALELLVNLTKDRRITHPWIQGKKHTTGKSLVVIIASNKGLCGGYNAFLGRTTASFLSKKTGSTYDAVTIGKYAEKIARKNSLNIVASFVTFSDFLETRDVVSVMKMIENYYTHDVYDSVEIIYTNFIKPLTYRPIVRTLLPATPKMIRDVMEELDEGGSGERFEKDSLKEYVFEPSEGAVIKKVLPMLITTTLYQMMLEAHASEHSSRMVAMKNASESAKEMQAELTLTFNKARQAAITQEIAEIVGGAEVHTS